MHNSVTKCKTKQNVRKTMQTRLVNDEDFKFKF